MNYIVTKAGDRVQMRECTENDVTYGLIAVHSKERYSGAEAMQQILLAFMNQLEHSFAMLHKTGPELQPATNYLKATEYWQDATGLDWKIQGWFNGELLLVLYVKNITASTVQFEERILKELLQKLA